MGISAIMYYRLHRKQGGFRVYHTAKKAYFLPQMKSFIKSIAYNWRLIKELVLSGIRINWRMKPHFIPMSYFCHKRNLVYEECLCNDTGDTKEKVN